MSDSTLPERWPIRYEDMQPFYERAEVLYRVTGTPDPLGQGGQPALRPPPPLSPRDQHLFDSFHGSGLHPYRVHVGCEFFEGCTGCAQGACPRGCKSDAARICLLPAIERHGASMLSQCEVLALEAGVAVIVQPGVWVIRPSPSASPESQNLERQRTIARKTRAMA